MTQTDIHDALVKSEFDFQGRLGNFLISDLLYAVADPRVRLGEGK